MRSRRDPIRRIIRSPLDAVVSLVCIAAAGWVAWHGLRWAVLDAAFGTTPQSCAGASGACWSVIGDFWRIFLVGLYPPESRWRAFIALGVLLTLAVVGAWKRPRWVPPEVLVAVPVLLVLLHGGVLGLAPVPTRNWGGLLISLGLAALGLATGIPCGILLALGRTSEKLRAVQACCTLFIELVRSVPFIYVLILGSIVLPVFLPLGWNLDPLLRVAGAIAFSAAANSAEIVRGGMASVDAGQPEAARALGLRTWHVNVLVVLPQALRAMLPVFVSMFIAYFKDTSLVVAVGLTDLLGAAGIATGNPKWLGRTIETYVFVGVIYFAICAFISRIGSRMEVRLRHETKDADLAAEEVTSGAPLHDALRDRTA